MQRCMIAQPGFTWIDVVAPEPMELDGLAEEHELHPLSVQDCLEPEHLPKIEYVEDDMFVILRVYDTASTVQSVTVPEFTRKIAVFVRGHKIITIHRAPMAFLDQFAHSLMKKDEELTVETFFLKLAKEAILTLELPMLLAEKEMDQQERHQGEDYAPTENSMFVLNILRRRLANLRRLLWHTSTVTLRVPFQSEATAVHMQDLRETVESLVFFADELLEDCNGLLNLQMTMASHRANEVIRVLTVFSVFFLPLNFICGIYGMNFRYMPETSWNWGYPMAWFLFVVVSLGIFFWFRRRNIL